jgi:hypothetical protein
LTAAQIADRLEETLALPAGAHDREERHHTMRAALAWSYDLLGEPERMLFRRLAVFRSGFILDAAAAVAPAISRDILSVLGGLVDKSLVEVIDGPGGQRRFRLLEPVRHFAAELLQASGERDDAAGRHRDHLLSRIPTPAPSDSASADKALAAEVDNVRAAVEYSLQASQPEAAITVILAYLFWWQDLGLLHEELDMYDAALGVADPARMSLGVRWGALLRASSLATFLGRVDAAAAFVEQLATLRDQHPESLAVRAAWADALATLTWFRADGDRSQANRLMRESRHAFEADGLSGWAAVAAAMILFAAIPWDSTDDPEDARAVREAALLIESTGGNQMLAMRVYESVIQVVGGASDAYPSCLDAFAQLDAHDGGFLAAWGGLCVGIAAELVGDDRVAAAQALRWLGFCRRSGVRMLLPCGIRGAARLSARAGHPEMSLRLWAGAEHTETVTGMRCMPLMERLDRPLRQQCTDALGHGAARLLAEGASWSVPEASQAAEEALLTLQTDD